jgi:hypothetical protein
MGIYFIFFASVVVAVGVFVYKKRFSRKLNNHISTHISTHEFSVSSEGKSLKQPFGSKGKSLKQPFGSKGKVLKQSLVLEKVCTNQEMSENGVFKFRYVNVNTN